MVIFNISRCITLLKTWLFFIAMSSFTGGYELQNHRACFFCQKFIGGVSWIDARVGVSHSPKTQNQQMNFRLRVRLWLKKWSYHGSFQVRSTRLLCLYIDIYLSNHEPNQVTTQDSNDHWPPASPASRDGRASRENYAEYIDGTKVDGSHILSSSSTFAWFLWYM